MPTSTTFDTLTIVKDDADPLAISVQLAGRSNSRDPSHDLLPWFTSLLDAAATGRARVEIHFEKLEYFNSSTISAVIQIINYAQRFKVPLTLVHDGGKRWQGMSFDALKRALGPFDAAGGGLVTFQVTR